MLFPSISRKAGVFVKLSINVMLINVMVFLPTGGNVGVGTV